MLISGDLINDTNDFTNDEFCAAFIATMTELVNNRFCFVTKGNHDIMTLCNSRFVEGNICVLNEILMQIPNTILLDNFEKVNLSNFDNRDNVSISGASLPYSFYEEYGENDEYFWNNLLSNSINFEDESYNIFLLHAIKNFLNSTDNKMLLQIDFVLGGHYHNRFIPSIVDSMFSGNNGIISPQREILPSNVRGINEIDDTYFLSLGPVNYRIENRFINRLFGTNISFVHIIPTKNWDRLENYYYKKRIIRK